MDRRGGAVEPTLLHVGLSLRYQIAGSGSVQFRSRPESFLPDYAVDTDQLEGGFGTVGLETTVRLGWIDLTDDDVRGGRMLTFHVGPAWTLNRHVRLLAGYVFAHVLDRPGAEIAHVVQSRIELWFQ